jgi:transcriptional regulator with XRE-family HTH domain
MYDHSSVTSYGNQHHPPPEEDEVSQSSPMIASWELALRLRERREQLGISINDVTEALGFTRNYWSAIENERKFIPANTLESVFDILDFPAEDRRQLRELREAAKGNGWWSQYSALFDSNLRRLYGLEHGAHQIRGYETLLIPGLLQTADYAKAVIESDATIRPVEVKQRVDIRLRRQERLLGDDPLDLKVIISEAALRQQIGGKEVLKGQLDHLLKMIEEHSENIEIRVIPFSATACDLFGSGTLHLLDFHSSRLPTVAWVESVTTRTVITDTGPIRDLVMAFNEGLDRALDRGKTKKLIERYSR